MSVLKPAIYVICETAHQCGLEHGRWINANQKPSSLKRAVRRLIDGSPLCPNWRAWMICTQKDFGDVRIWEYDNLETISKIARFVAKEGELGAALVNYFSNVEEAKQALQEDYCGAYESKEHFVAEHFNIFPDIEGYHIDYESFASDIFAGNFFALEVEDTTHVFADRANG